MENKSHALITGIFTLTLIIATIWGGIWFNRDRTERIPYLLATNQPVSGLNPQAPVRYRGLMVGRVKQIRFDPQTRGQILVEIGVNPDTPITASTYATLGYQGVTGIAFIQLDDDGSRPQLLGSNAGQLARIPLRGGLLQQMESNARQILAQSEELTRRANALLASSNQQKLFDTLDKFGKAAEKFQAVPDKLQPTLERLPIVMQTADKSLQAIHALSQDTRVLTNNINQLALKLQAPDGTITKINQSVDQIGLMAGNLDADTVPRFNTLVEDARNTVKAFSRTANNLNERPQNLIFGPAASIPGPGEPGFIAPGNSSNP